MPAVPIGVKKMNEYDVRNGILNHAFIETVGDPSVGIQPYLCCIDQIGFNLRTMPVEDQPKAIEEFREALAAAFEIVLGETPIVWFESERR